MYCPHCQTIIDQMTAEKQFEQTREVLFEICSRCGNIWIDFGATRPKLHRAVEAQVARWEILQHTLIQQSQEQAG